MKDASETITFRKPTAEDGGQIWELIRSCKPLDENSMYCNLIQCDHFADTCVVAEIDGELAGWISGYLLPDDPKTLFVWQVAVGKNARGRGLGRRMLAAILDRPECDQVERMQTTITKDNDASWGLFKGFASRRDADLSSEPHFRKEVHFQGEHDTEHMVTISLEEAAPAMRSAA